MHATLSQVVGLLRQHEVEARRCIVSVLRRCRHPSGVVHVLGAVTIMGFVYVSPVAWRSCGARSRCVNLRRAHHGVHVVELRHVQLHVHAGEREHGHV